MNDNAETLMDESPLRRLGGDPLLWQTIIEWSRPLSYSQYEVIMP